MKYQEVSGQCPKKNKISNKRGTGKSLDAPWNQLARPEGLEPPTYGFEERSPISLSFRIPSKLTQVFQLPAATEAYPIQPAKEPGV